MSSLPKGWAQTALNNISTVVRGITFPASAKETSHTPENVCCLRTSNIQREVEWSDIYFVARSFVKRTEQFVQSGDILMSMANSYELVGKVAIAKEVDYPTAFGAFLSAIRPTTAIDGKYLFHLLRTVQVQSELRQGSSQTTNIANISVGTLANIEVPLAPLPEQKHIADKLDTVLARVDACRDRLDRLPTLLKRFRQSILAVATSGRLTEDWRNGDATELSWRLIQLGDYVENLDGKREPISEVLRTSRRGPFPYYGASGVIDTIDGYTHDGKFLLIGEDGANLLTRTKPIAFLAEGKIWVNNHAHVLKCRDGAPEEYLGYFINSIDLTPYVSGSAQPKLNQKNMNAIIVPVPPVYEQHEIVRRVETLFAFADRLEARLATARQQVEQLTPALLAKAFRGELVPQDPADEPASALLQRLAAQRESAPPAKGRRRKAPASA